MAVRLLVALCAAAGVFALLGPPLVGEADVSGAGCSAHIAGEDAAAHSSTDSSQAVPVRADQTVNVDLSGDTSATGVHVDYGLLGGVSIGKDGSGTTYSARVGDYVSLPGLYLVQAHTVPGSGCTAAVLVRVDGSPLGTAAGDASAAAIGLGTAGVLAGALVAGAGSGGVPSGADLGAAMLGDAAAADAGSPAPSPPAGGPPAGDEVVKEDQIGYDPVNGWWEGTPVYDPGPPETTYIQYQMPSSIPGYPPVTWSMPTVTFPHARRVVKKVSLCGAALPMALLMTTLVMVGAMPAGRTAQTIRVPMRPRVRWRPRLSFLGIAGGLLGSLGAAAYMELNGNVYPTRAWTIRALVGGLVVGLVIPSLGNAVAAWRGNRRLAAVKRRSGWEGVEVKLSSEPPPPTQAPPPGEAGV